MYLVFSNRKVIGMPELTILSWNVNGIRAVERKNGFHWFFEERPAIFCLQETKAHVGQLSPQLTEVDGYQIYFSSAERKGYSGVALYSKIPPRKVNTGIGIARFDAEGRFLIADYGEWVLLNIYFPNGKASAERLKYKMDFYDAFLDYVNDLKSAGKKILICGDVNTAHQEIDLARPKENAKVSGFLPEERAWIDLFISHGYVDTFRLFNQSPANYTWWDYKSRARERNVGWRIDYFFVSENFKERIRSAFIRSDIMGSDHCPVGVTLTV